MCRLDVDVPLLKEFLQVEAKNETTPSSQHYLDDYRDFESKVFPSSQHYLDDYRDFEPFPSHRLRP